MPASWDHNSKVTSSKTSTGLMALLIILMIDAALGVWFWYRRQANQENYNFTSMNLPTVQETDAPEPAYRPPPSAAAVPAARSENAPSKPVPGKPQAASSRMPTRTKDPLSQAAGAVISMQMNPKYRKSPIIRRWQHDFLSYSDLRAVNQRYWHDRNVVAFVIGTLRSPNFPKLITQYASSGDVQAFAHELMAMPGVLSAGRLLMQNPQVSSAAKNVNFPGLPSIGALMNIGASAGGSLDSLTSPQALERMEKDPNINKFIQQQTSPVPLQNQNP